MASKAFKEKLQKRKDEVSKGGSGSYDYFIFKEGTTRLRPLPVGEDVEFGFEVTSFFLGKDIGGIISPVSFGKKCAINEKYESLKNSKSESDQELAGKFKPRRKIMVPHIKKEDDKGLKVDEGAGAKLAMLSGGQYSELLDLFLDDEQGDFTNIDEGYDIKYKRTGKGQFDTEYTLVPCKPSRLPLPYRKQIYNPEKMVRALLPTYEETQEYISKFLKLNGGSSKGKKLSDKEDKGELVRKKKKKIRSNV